MKLAVAPPGSAIVAAALLSLAGFLCSGCGTMMALTMYEGSARHGNPWDEYDEMGLNAVYGGTALDFKLITLQGGEGERLFDRILFAWVGLLDLPFSLVGDTLLLPLTIPRQVALNRRRRAPPEPEVEEPVLPED